MSNNAQFASTPRTAATVIGTANTAVDGSGTIDTVFTAGSSGSRIDSIMVKAMATTTAGVCRLWLHNGSNYFLWQELIMPAATPSATVLSSYAALDNIGLILANGWSLCASTHNANNMAVLVTRAGDF